MGRGRGWSRGLERGELSHTCANQLVSGAKLIGDRTDAMPRPIWPAPMTAARLIGPRAAILSSPSTDFERRTLIS